MRSRSNRPLVPFLIGSTLVAAAATAGAQQLEVTYRDADLGGTVDVVMKAPIGTLYVTIAALTEGPTCFGPKHPVGCIDVDLNLFDLSFLLPGFFGTMPSPGTLTEQFDLDPDPALDGIVANVQMVSLVNGKFTTKSNLTKVTFAFNDEWLHSVAPLLNDSAVVPAIALDDGRIALFGAQGANLDLCEAWEPWRQVSTALAAMPAGRAGHTVTKLQDGRVLVTGGADTALVVSNAGGLYDPATDTWSATGLMTSPRVAHSANLLPDGRVLLCGGTTDASDVLAGATHALKTTEFYDPATNSFAAGPNLARPHVAHTAVTMATGDVLIGAGATFRLVLGIPIPDVDNHAQAYQPSTGAFTAEATMKAKRAGPSGVLLADGRVLFAGGIGGSITSPSNLATAEVFNPTTTSWSFVGSMSIARSGMPMVVLPGTNQVLVAGGGTGTNLSAPVPTDVVELFDPVTNTFLVKSPMLEPRAGSAAIVLGSNHAALFGGVGAPTAVAIYHD
jgi:N-acetylneuraminic acid mutarotase